MQRGARLKITLRRYFAPAIDKVYSAIGQKTDDAFKSTINTV
jgi:hypothetical protein